MSQERTAEDWGRVAVSLPGWTWMPRMYDGGRRQTILAGGRSGAISAVFPTRPGVKGERWPDPDDPATEGCMMRLLTRTCWYRAAVLPLGAVVTVETPDGLTVTGRSSTLGRACIAAAEALGRWPGGRP